MGHQPEEDGTPAWLFRGARVRPAHPPLQCSGDNMDIIGTRIRSMSSALVVSSIIAVLLSTSALAQVAPAAAQSKAATTSGMDVATMIAGAEEDGSQSMYYVEQLARADVVQSVPMLEKKFDRTQDPIDKAHVASVLIQLGDNTGKYWDFLEQTVKQAINSDAPAVNRYDKQGRTIPGLSPEFERWAKGHNLSPGDAAEEQLYRVPGIIIFLGATGDTRAIPLLRKGLLSSSHQIQVFAAMALAQLQDRNSVPLIIEACQKAPAEVAAGIAQSLVFFDDPEAQRAVDRYIPADQAKIFRQARANGEKPLGK